MAGSDEQPPPPPSESQSSIWSEENEDSDWDSALGSETSSITQSLSTSIMAYEYEDGRRYHAYEAGRYYLPNDEHEASRLDLQHKIWRLVLHNKLYRAPLDTTKLHHALDIGTGTGIWAIEFADEHPSCEIIGTDLSPIQPTWTPPNCSFLVDDLDSDRDWDFPRPLDYVHSRAIVASVRSWPRYIQRCFNTLRPGGYCELVEIELPLHCTDGSADPSTDALMIWGQGLYDAGQKYGADFHCQRKLKGYMEEAGFVDVVKEEYKWPIGTYSNDSYLDEIGYYMVPNAQDMMDATKAMFSRVLGWGKEEIEVFNAKFRTSVRDPTKHRYFVVSVTYGRKPERTDANASANTATAEAEEAMEVTAQSASSNPTETKNIEAAAPIETTERIAPQVSSESKAQETGIL